MENQKRHLEEVYREISEWEISEESGETAPAAAPETLDVDQLEAYLKSVESDRGRRQRK